MLGKPHRCLFLTQLAKCTSLHAPTRALPPLDVFDAVALMLPTVSELAPPWSAFGDSCCPVSRVVLQIRTPVLFGVTKNPHNFRAVDRPQSAPEESAGGMGYPDEAVECDVRAVQTKRGV